MQRSIAEPSRHQKVEETQTNTCEAAVCIIVFTVRILQETRHVSRQPKTAQCFLMVDIQFPDTPCLPDHICHPIDPPKSPLA